MNTADFSFTKFAPPGAAACVSQEANSTSWGPRTVAGKNGGQLLTHFWHLQPIGGFQLSTKKGKKSHLWDPATAALKQAPLRNTPLLEGISWDQDTPKIEGLVGFICWWHMLPLVGKYVTILLVSSCSPTNIKEAEHDTTILNRQWPLKLGLYLSYILLISCGTSWWRK